MKTCPACDGRGVIPDAKVCANENCERTFTWQEGRKVNPDTVKGSRADAIYCSHRCAKAQNERAYRRRKKGSTR